MPFGDFAFDLMVLERGLADEAENRRLANERAEQDAERVKRQRLRETGHLPPAAWPDVPEGA